MRSLVPAALALLAACAGPPQSGGGDPPPAAVQPPTQAPVAVQPPTQPPAARQPPAGSPPAAVQPPVRNQPAPAEGGGQVTIDVQQGSGTSAGADEQQARAEGGDGTVVIRGVATTPTPCHKLSGTVERSGGVLQVRISATADPEVMCVASIGAIPYTATVRGLAAGTYTLRVMHAYPNTGWDTAAVLETGVTVR